MGVRKYLYRLSSQGQEAIRHHRHSQGWTLFVVCCLFVCCTVHFLSWQAWVFHPLHSAQSSHPPHGRQIFICVCQQSKCLRDNKMNNQRHSWWAIVDSLSLSCRRTTTMTLIIESLAPLEKMRNENDTTKKYPEWPMLRQRFGTLLESNWWQMKKYINPSTHSSSFRLFFKNSPSQPSYLPRAYPRLSPLQVQSNPSQKPYTTMSLFKSNKNKSASAAASPAQSPRTSIDARRPVVEGNTMTREQAVRLAMHNSQQKLPHNFSLL